MKIFTEDDGPFSDQRWLTKLWNTHVNSPDLTWIEVSTNKISFFFFWKKAFAERPVKKKNGLINGSSQDNKPIINSIYERDFF